MDIAPPNPVFFLLLAFFSLALATLVHFKARPGPVRNYFSLFAISVAIWLASGFLLYSDIDPQRGLFWARIAFAAGALLILNLYHVLILFPDLESAPFGRLVTAVGGLLALLSVFSPLLAREVTSTGVFKINVVYGPLFLPFTVYAVTVLISGVYALVRRFRDASGLRRLQIQYLLLGTAIPVAAVLLTNLVLPVAFNVFVVAPYGRLLALVFLPVTAHAIIRHRLMDIKLFVEKAVVFVCAIAAGATIFSGLLWLLGSLTPSTPGISIRESFAIALIIAALFHPVKNWIERALNRYFYRERHDYPKILKESSERLSTTLEAPSTATYIMELVSRMFRAELVRVYLRDASRDAFVAFNPRAYDADRHLESVVAVTSPLPSYLQRGRRLLIRDEILQHPEDRSVGAAITELRDLGGELAIAFWHLGRLWGFVIVGAKLSGDPYFSEDIDFMLTLGSQAAIAIENLQLHRQMEEERLRAERLGVIGTLASGIAHEIKNPLVAIRTFAELLPERFSDEDFHGEFSKVVMREIGRIDGLVARLRELASRPAQQLVALDLRTPIDETLALLRGQLEQKQIRVSTDYGKDVTLILGESNLLKQLFLNLFMNAIEAMEAGGELGVRLRRRQILGTSGMVAEVTNNGTQIPEDIVAQIFEPFFSTKPGGSGLGLAICRNIADAHRATIRVRNNASPKGVTFIVEFPVSDLLTSESHNGAAKANAIHEPREIGNQSGTSHTGS
jgi:signal transduction histidine kinase